MRDTLQQNSALSTDYRFSRYITQEQWQQRRIGAEGQTLIQGIPAGGRFEEYVNNITRYADSRQAFASFAQAANLMWTGLSAEGGAAYRACLDAYVLAQGGLHLTVLRATTSDIVLRVHYLPRRGIGSMPPTISLAWSGAIPARDTSLPQSINLGGSQDIRILRPTVESSVTVNSGGSESDSIIITPLPPRPQERFTVRLVDQPFRNSTYTQVRTTSTFRDTNGRERILAIGKQQVQDAVWIAPRESEPEAVVTFQLNKRFLRLTGKAGIYSSHEADCNSLANVRYQILVDGKMKFDQTIRGADSVPFEVSVENAAEVALRASGLGPNGSARCQDGAMGDLRLEGVR